MPQNHTVTVHSAHTRPDDPYVFADCKWKVDDRGCLHIFRASDARNEMVAAFSADTGWFVHADAEVWQ